MRFSTDLTSITEPRQMRQYTGTVHFRGRTTNTTSTELFIDGITNRRLVLTAESSVLLKVTGVNSNTFHTEGRFLFLINASGGIVIGDLDGTTGGSQGAELGAAVLGSGVSAPRSSLMQATGANSYSWTLVPGTATTPPFLRLFVTGPASATDWEFAVEFLEAGGKG